MGLDDTPFGITSMIVVLIAMSTALTWIIPSAFGRAVFATITAPFNIAIEGNIIGNFVVLVVIVAFGELYMKSRGRGTVFSVAVVSSIAATYIVVFYVNLVAPVGTLIVASGTSIIGASLLAFLVPVFVYDLFAWSRRLLSENDSVARNVAEIVGAFALTIIGVAGIITLFKTFYVTDNTSFYLHVFGSIIAVALTSIVLLFREWTMPREKAVKRERWYTNPEWNF